MMLLAETNDAEPYLKSGEWCMQEKLNGERRLVEWDGESLCSYNRQGRIVDGAGCIGISLKTAFVIDGELVDDKFAAFDLLSWNGESCEELPQWARFARLLQCSPFPVVASTRMETMKRASLDIIRENKGEGVVFKRQEARYRDGRSPDCVKFKFWQSETFLVESVDVGKGSIGLSKGGVPCGRVAFSMFDGLPAIGTPVEVRFIAWTKNGKLAHPVCLGERKDIDPATV